MRVSENALLARARGHLLRRGAVLAAFMLLVALLCASPAWAKTFTVTNLNDSPTAQTSSLATPSAPFISLLPVPSVGGETRVQLLPFQCAVVGLAVVLGLLFPTTQMSLAAIGASA